MCRSTKVEKFENIEMQMSINVQIYIFKNTDVYNFEFTNF